MTKYIFALGRQPEIGTVELERLLGSDSVSLLNKSVAGTNRVINPDIIKRLGGSKKIGKVIAESEQRSWNDAQSYIRNNILTEVLGLSEGKIDLGVSYYDLDTSPSQINASNLAFKKVIKSRGRPVRIVPNKEVQLSTAQVLHNQLTGNHGFELLVVKTKTGLIFAKTESVQDINGYANRDQNRPKRDARVGMLPPKLAQILINLANPQSDSLVVDVFCGTGVILQEALLMGFRVYGSDISPKMVDYATINLEWLAKSHANLPSWQVETADATNHEWEEKNISLVCETHLGKPLVRELPREQLEKESSEVNNLVRDFLVNAARQLKPGSVLSVAVPAWTVNGGFNKLPLLDHLGEIGYNLMSFKNVDASGLIYARPNQLVARQLLVLIRK